MKCYLVTLQVYIDAEDQDQANEKLGNAIRAFDAASGDDATELETMSVDDTSDSIKL